MNNKLIRKALVLNFIFLFVFASFLLIIDGNAIKSENIDNESENLTQKTTKNSMLDMEFIKSITENLSYIIFTEYNEESGEIAKGRAYGSKGERKAAEILYENMTELGLFTIKQKIQNLHVYEKLWNLTELTHIHEALDYKMIITNITNNFSEEVECEITPLLLNKKEHEKIYNFSYKNLKVVKYPTNITEFIEALKIEKLGEDFLFIDLKDRVSKASRNIYVDLPLDVKIHRKIFYPIRAIGKWFKFKVKIKEKILNNCFPHRQGTIIYDFLNIAHHTGCNVRGVKLPELYINGTIGKKILNNTENFRVDFYIKQQYNSSVESYNVIGQLNGTDPSKTIILDCLYDSAQCQGTGDAAMGMAIVMGIAKYFTDNNITPEYNIKFIGFAGEEAGNRGPKYFNSTNPNENIIYVIDMNQVGYYQPYPRNELNVIFNRLRGMNKVWKIVERTDYVKRIGDTANIVKRWWPEGVLSNEYVFHERCPTVVFLKAHPWLMHHKDGMGHTAGDVMDIYDPLDVEATGEIVLNVTLYLTTDIDEEIETNNQNIYISHNIYSHIIPTRILNEFYNKIRYKRSFGYTK